MTMSAVPFALTVVLLGVLCNTVSAAAAINTAFNFAIRTTATDSLQQLQQNELEELLYPTGLYKALKAGDCAAINNHYSQQNSSIHVGDLWFYTTPTTDLSSINNCILKGVSNTTYFTSLTSIVSTKTITSSDNSTSCSAVIKPPFYNQSTPQPENDIVTQIVTATNQATVNKISRGFSNSTVEWNCFTGLIPTNKTLQQKEERMLSVFSTTFTATNCNAATEIVCYNANPKVLQFQCMPITWYCAYSNIMCIPANAQSGGYLTDAALRQQFCDGPTPPPTGPTPSVTPTPAPTPATTPQPGGGAAALASSSIVSVLLAVAACAMMLVVN